MKAYEVNFQISCCAIAKKKKTAIWSLIAGPSPSLENGQRAMWVELVDVLMIDVGFTDVTWSHAWNSVWGSSYRDFLIICGRPVNNRRGSRGCWSSWQGSQCSLLSASVLHWTFGNTSTAVAPGNPQAHLHWSQSLRSHLLSTTECTV